MDNPNPKQQGKETSVSSNASSSTTSSSSSAAINNNAGGGGTGTGTGIKSSPSTTGFLLSASNASQQTPVTDAVSASTKRASFSKSNERVVDQNASGGGRERERERGNSVGRRDERLSTTLRTAAVLSNSSGNSLSSSTTGPAPTAPALAQKNNTQPQTAAYKTTFLDSESDTDHPTSLSNPSSVAGNSHSSNTNATGNNNTNPSPKIGIILVCDDDPLPITTAVPSASSNNPNTSSSVNTSVSSSKNTNTNNTPNSNTVAKGAVAKRTTTTTKRSPNRDVSSSSDDDDDSEDSEDDKKSKSKSKAGSATSATAGTTSSNITGVSPLGGISMVSGTSSATTTFVVLGGGGLADSNNTTTILSTTEEDEEEGITKEEEVEDLAEKDFRETGFKVGFAEDRNKRYRRTMEDAHTIQIRFGDTPGSGFFAVFDGHAGRTAADFCGDTVHKNFAKNLKENPSESPAAIFHQTFLQADKELASLKGVHSGCTAICAFIRTEDRGDGVGKVRVLYTANVGDARAVLSRADSGVLVGESGDNATAVVNHEKKTEDEEEVEGGGWIQEDEGQGGGVQALRLSYDHKGSDANESRRISEGGGFMMNHRVNGVLAVTRSLGDLSMKEWVLGAPYTTETILEEGDETLIIACDGIWDVCPDQEAVSLIRALKEDPQEAADCLVDFALDNRSTDNLTAIVIRIDTKFPK